MNWKTKVEFEKTLHATLCKVYGMGLPRDASWLALAGRIHRTTMLRRLHRLELLKLVTCKLDGTTMLWSVTEKGHQTILENMKRKPKTRAKAQRPVAAC
jgi:hypothetical protein